MKQIAIPTRDGMVDDHFGHCAYYTIFQIDDENKIQKSERLDSPQGCGCKSNIAGTLQEMGVSVMLAGNMGQGAFNKLSEHNICVIRGCSGKVEDVAQSYLNGSLADSAEMCDHHSCGNHEHEHVFKI